MLQCKIMFYNNYYFLWWKLLKIYNQNHIFGVSRWLLMAFHSIMIKTNMWRKSKAFCGFIFYHMQWKLNKLHNFRRNKKQWNTVKPNPYSDIFLAALFVSLSSVLLLEIFGTEIQNFSWFEYANEYLMSDKKEHKQIPTNLLKYMQ